MLEYDIINNYLIDYDLDPKNVLKFMTIKSIEIFSNAIRNNKKAETNQFPFGQEAETIAFLIGIIMNIMKIRRSNGIQNHQKEEIFKQCIMLGVYYDRLIEGEKKAFEVYLKAAEEDMDLHHTLAAENSDVSSQYIVAIYYNDGKCIPKDEDKGFYWNRKAAINMLNIKYQEPRKIRRKLQHDIPD
ncbi:hypothetical protein C1645_812285 [Glomus cerebriforme]|uniref:Uncharacterized protein n=1 Tax=Glomus cerebriforme TaxID=658196 RepID=A0A397TUI5_9GLOM|nr:hypothetical protein C1645_812285 [Glomus cerebriforme]